MKVVICADRINGTMELYLCQLEVARIPTIWGPPKTPIGHEIDEAGKPTGFSWEGKLRFQQETLESLPPDEKVVLSDGWDVIFQGTAEEAEAKIPSDKILFSGEKNCWPDPQVQKSYPMGPTPWMFVNAGSIAGPAGLLLNAINVGFRNAKLRPELIKDDQRFWTDIFLHDHRTKIDYQCILFQSMFLLIGGMELGIREGGRLVNLRTKTYPNFFHYNGGGNWPEDLLKQLGMC